MIGKEMKMDIEKVKIYLFLNLKELLVLNTYFTSPQNLALRINYDYD
jgi:hypothetical protein